MTKQILISKGSPILLREKRCEKSDDEAKRGIQISQADEISNDLKGSTDSLTSKRSDATTTSTPGMVQGTIIEAESLISRPDSPDFFDKIKENFKDKMEDIHRVEFFIRFQNS